MAVAAGGSTIRIVNAHLANRAPASLQQLRRLRWLLAADVDTVTIALGDLNVPGFIAAAMTGYDIASRAPTRPAKRPMLRLDNVLARGCETGSVKVTVMHVGSDHRAVRAAVCPPT